MIFLNGFAFAHHHEIGGAASARRHDERQPPVQLGTGLEYYRFGMSLARQAGALRPVSFNEDFFRALDINRELHQVDQELSELNLICDEYTKKELLDKCDADRKTLEQRARRYYENAFKGIGATIVPGTESYKTTLFTGTVEYKGGKLQVELGPGWARSKALSPVTASLTYLFPGAKDTRELFATVNSARGNRAHLVKFNRPGDGNTSFLEKTYRDLWEASAPRFLPQVKREIQKYWDRPQPFGEPTAIEIRMNLPELPKRVVQELAFR
jgi:hypothetical protein